MGVPPEHLALVKNTGHALSIVADGLILEPGDNVVLAACDYPAVVYPWYAQQWRGVETRLVPTRPDDTLSAGRLRRSDGRRVPASCRSPGCSSGRATAQTSPRSPNSRNATTPIFVVDVIQGLGALPLDSTGRWAWTWSPPASHKWLMAPGGTGGLYIAPHVLDRMRLVNMGAASVVDVVKFDPLTFTPKPTAQRYEEGTPNGLGLLGLDAALSLIEEVGIGAIGDRVLDLAAHAADALTRKGYIVTSPWMTPIAPAS